MSPQSNPYRFVIAGLLLFFSLFVGMNFVAIAPIMPLIIDDYDLSRGTASLLMGLVIAANAASAIPGSIVVARFPLKAVFGVGWLMSGAMVLTPLANQFEVLLLLRLAYGVSFGLVWPAFAPLQMRWFSRRELPIINGLVITFLTMGIGIASLATAPIVQLIGWQPTLSVIGAPLAVGALAWAILGRVPPQGEAEMHQISFGEMWRAMRSRTTLLLGLADGAAFAQYMALTTWLPTYYSQVMGMSLSRAGFIVSLVPLAGIIAVLTGGVLTAHSGLRKPFFLVAGAIAGLAGFGCFLSGNMVILHVSVVALGFASYFYLPALLTVPMEMEGVGPNRIAVVWGAMVAIAGTFAIISPITVGFMADATGSYKPGFTLWAILAWGLLLVGLLLPETGPGRRHVARP